MQSTISTHLRVIILSVLMMLVVVGTMSPSHAQNDIRPIYFDFDPAVVPFERTEPVRFETKVQGNPSSVVLELNAGGELVLNDGGVGADRFANDGIWSTAIEMDSIVGNMTELDVFRPFVGFLSTFQNGSQFSRSNIFADVITDFIPRLPITQLAPDVQHTDVLVNIVDPALAFSLENGGSVQVPTQRFYQFFGDDYDFISVISARSVFGNRFHFPAKNDVAGIGRLLFDDTAQYGSVGQLQGFLMFPLPFFYDGAGEGFQHELAHQWIMWVDAPPFSQGIPHWPLSSMAGGMMGWSSPFGGQGQAFLCDVTVQNGQVRMTPRDSRISPVFNDLDLYLMGLMPASQVGENVVFVDQDHQRLLNQCDGSIYGDPVIHISAQDIVNAHGPRFPDASVAPKTFRVATIIVSPDELLSEDVMAFYSHFTRRAESEREELVQSGFFQGVGLPFFLSTQGLGRIDTRL